MTEKLNIISSDLLTNVSQTEVNELIAQMVDKSKNNMEDISELTLECTSLLTSAENKSSVLSNQGIFNRLIRNITGKNHNLQNAILQNNTNALYAAQGVISRVMIECTNNRSLFLAVIDKVNNLYIELKQNQNHIENTVLITRQAIVNFYKKCQEEIIAQDERISLIEEYVNVRCPKCQNELLTWQRVCSFCGCIHPLKNRDMSEKTRKTLIHISEIIKDNTFTEDIEWDLNAKKIERVLHKVETLAEIGKLPGYTDELARDIKNLRKKCKYAEFQIAIVGVMKAGKSYLMNALIGAEIASVDINPETAALTKFRSANGFYVIVKFHNKMQWEKLKESAKNSKKIVKDSLGEQLNNITIEKLESKWIGHENVTIHCQNLKDLQNEVKKYTSSQEMKHLFVSEVEVGVDKSIFNMPKEVVFVDTPGLKDPVKYRSNITKKYLKKADSVLIALKPGPFTTEGLEIVTTVLDCTEKDKTYIIGTQKDLNSEIECKDYVSNWVDHLVKAKRYSDKRQAMSRIILTTAKMDIFINKWSLLSEKEKENEECFSTNDYNDLESYSGKMIKKRGFNLMMMSDEDCAIITKSTGIPTLRNKLESSLITNYRKLKMEDIKSTFLRCKKQISLIGQTSIEQQKKSIELAKAGAEDLREQINSMEVKKETLIAESTDLKIAAEKLENDIKIKIESLERKEK